MKILAIDDNPDNLIALQAVVSDRLPGTRVLTALNGPQGIDMALAEDPDVILLDIVMPGMDGYAVCRKLKEDERLQMIPVLFLTALKTDADLLDATTRAQTAADRTRRYVSRQLELGDAGTFALQTAEAADAQAQSALIQARTARLNDSVALIQALGGGWDAKAN